MRPQQNISSAEAGRSCSWSRDRWAFAELVSAAVHAHSDTIPAPVAWMWPEDRCCLLRGARLLQLKSRSNTELRWSEPRVARAKSSVLVTRTALHSLAERRWAASNRARWQNGRPAQRNTNRTNHALGGTFYAQIKASSVDRFNSPNPVEAGGGGRYICIMYPN